MRRILFNPVVSISVGIVAFLIAFLDLGLTGGTDFSSLSGFGKTMLVLFCVCLVWAIASPIVARLRK